MGWLQDEQQEPARWKVLVFSRPLACPGAEWRTSNSARQGSPGASGQLSHLCVTHAAWKVHTNTKARLKAEHPGSDVPTCRSISLWQSSP